MSAAADQARARILGAVRKALDVGPDDGAREEAVRTRLEGHPESLVPARARQSAAALTQLFTEKLEGQGATLDRVEGADAVPETVARYLRDTNLPAEIRTGADKVLGAMPWETTQIERRTGRALGSDAVAVSRAVGAAAETGTLFLTSGADNPTTLNFLPDTHIVTIDAADIAGSYEDIWTLLRETYGPRTLPRTVNMVSGPSRTADIEQTIVMGAHGPRRLHVIVVDNTADPAEAGDAADA